MLITKAIFGFMDEETGKKLREFYQKHTGVSIKFNNIQHYQNGFKLLVFDLPLGKISTIGITAAVCHPNYVKTFHSLNEFISWYENVYLKENPQSGSSI